MISRVLVVDDYEPWRHHIRATLAGSERWIIAGEASDGIDAVRQARALRPDLILLDVGLPGQSGIAAAAQIIRDDPDARILFVSEHRSWDVAEAAMAAGARGYIIKSDSGRELSPAMEALAQGRRFIATRLGGRAADVPGGGSVQEMLRHEVGFYSREEFFLDDCARLAEAALRAGNSFIVVALPPRRHKLRQRLKAGGVDVDRAIAERRYVSVDVGDVLSKLFVDGSLDESRFWVSMTSLILSAARASTRDHPHISAFGECAPLLWREGNRDAAVRLEQLWHEVVQTFEIDVFCGYLDVDRHHAGDVYQHICATHTIVHSR